MTGPTPVDDKAFDGLSLDGLADLVEDQYYVFLAASADDGVCRGFDQ